MTKKREALEVKHCPTCGNTYTDDTLVYCLQDGATLQRAGEETNPLNLIATLHDDAQGYEAPTESTKLSSAPTIEISTSALPTVVNQGTLLTARVTGDAASATEQPSSTTRVIATTVVITLLLLIVGGVGAWMLFRGRARRAAEANSASTVSTDSPDAANTSNGNQARGENRPDKGGRWFVILGSFPKEEMNRANERLELIRRQGFDARIVSSDDYPNLKSGLWLIVMGPYTRNNAEEILGQVRPKVKDAYTKSGW